MVCRSRRVRIKRFLQLGIAIAGLTGASAFADTFSVHDQWNFGPTNDGVFVYGVANQPSPLNPYGFTLYTERVGGGAGTVEHWTFPGLVAETNARLNRTDQTSVGVPADTVAFHPRQDNSMAVIRLNTTFGTDQVVNVSGFFGAGDQGAVDLYIVDFGFGAGNTTLFSVLNTLGDTPFNLDFVLPAGHTIDFLVGSAGSFLFDSTPLTATISTRGVNGDVPEPATGLLLVLGAVGLGAARRRLK
jgi:hypothetical protein